MTFLHCIRYQMFKPTLTKLLDKWRKKCQCWVFFWGWGVLFETCLLWWRHLCACHTHTHRGLSNTAAVSIFLFPWADLADLPVQLLFLTVGLLFPQWPHLQMLLLVIPLASASDITGWFHFMTNEGITWLPQFYRMHQGFLDGKELIFFDTGNCKLLFHTLPKSCGISQFRVFLTVADNWKSSQGCTALNSAVICCS